MKISSTNDRIDTFQVIQGDTRGVTVDFAAHASDLGVSTSSVLWSVDQGDSVSVSGTPTIASDISVGTLVADSNKTGCSMIRVTATFSDGQTVTKAFKVNSVDTLC